MCGISGIIRKDNGLVSSKAIKAMNDLIAHRGPDGEGFFYEKNFALAHRRLAILDLSDDGKQPMQYSDDLSITYNGEIYNYIELKNELMNLGYKFTTRTDTEVILVAYKEWGAKCVEKFNGMWAFAIFDRKKNILLCSRDRFGIKPFYFMNTEKCFYFGSEIKQLLYFMKNACLNNNVFVDFLFLNLLDHSHETFFENIYKLPPSCNLTYDLTNHSYNTSRFYEIAEHDKHRKLSFEDAMKGYKELFFDSIRIRLRSDVKVGTCLSGGLDSSSIAAIASDIYQNASGEHFSAIHAKSTENETDESHFAKEVAIHSKLDLHCVEPLNKDFFDAVDRVIFIQEEPFSSPSIFMQYYVMKKAKDINCKVMLDGQGGDETLLGYENYYEMVLADLLKKSCFIKFVRMFSEIKSFKLSKFQILVKTILSIFPFIRMKRLAKNSFLKNIDSHIPRLKKYLKYQNIWEFQRNQIAMVSLPALLRYEDKNSMSQSVEARLPFLDYRLIDFSLNLPINFKLKNGYLKYLLRKVVEKILPDNLVWRTNKFGFECPRKLWQDFKETDGYRQEIKKSKILSHFIDFEKLPDDENLVWKLFNIARWEELFNVKLSPR